MNSLGLNRISPSMLMEYKNCPKAFFYKCWLGLKLPQPMIHLIFGTAVHAGIDMVYEQYDTDGGWKLAEFGLVKDKFLSLFRLDMLPDEDPAKVLEFQEDGIEMLKSYWDKKEELLNVYGVNPDQLEVVMKLPIKHPETDEMLEVPMSLRIDGIGNEVIAEFKTSKGRYDSVASRSLPQSLSYNLAYYSQHGKLPKKLVYVVLLKGRKKEDRIQVLSYSYDKSDISTFFEEIKSILAKIKNREFNRPAKGHPRFCDCSKFEEALKYDKEAVRT